MKIPAVLRKSWPWFALFLIFFSLFLGLFRLESAMEKALVKYWNFLSSRHIDIQNPEIDRLHLSLHIRSIAIPVMDSRLLVRDVDARLELFPPCLRISCQILGGQLQALAYMGLTFSPVIKNASFSLSGARMNDLPEKLKQNMFAHILEGQLNVRGEAELGFDMRRPDWQKIQGTINMDLDQAALNLLVPVLKKTRLENIKGKSLFLVSGSNINIKLCELSSPPLSFKAQGEIKNYPRGRNCRLALQTELQIPESEINPSLVPARTREQIKKNGFVRARLTGALSNPEIYLEN